MADWFDDAPDPAPAVSGPPLSVVPDGDWFDAEAAAQEPPATPSQNLTRLPRRLMAAVLLTIITIATAAMLASRNSPAPPPAAATGPTAAPVPPWCHSFAAGDTVSTSAADNGLAAIAAFEDAYYGATSTEGARASAEAARAHVAVDAQVGSVDDLAAGIASVPIGTDHCVLASTVHPGLYRVDIFARQPDGHLDHFKQTIATVSHPDAPHGALITSIIARED